MAVIKRGDSGWEALLEIWLASRKTGYIQRGGMQYEVFTPDGDEEPVFHPQGQQELTSYSSTSTGAVKAKDPVRKSGKK